MPIRKIWSTAFGSRSLEHTKTKARFASGCAKSWRKPRRAEAICLLSPLSSDTGLD
jgi:hypothetical protein